MVSPIKGARHSSMRKDHGVLRNQSSRRALGRWLNWRLKLRENWNGSVKPTNAIIQGYPLALTGQRITTCLSPSLFDQRGPCEAPPVLGQQCLTEINLSFLPHHAHRRNAIRLRSQHLRSGFSAPDAIHAGVDLVGSRANAEEKPEGCQFAFIHRFYFLLSPLPSGRAPGVMMPRPAAGRGYHGRRCCVPDVAPHTARPHHRTLNPYPSCRHRQPSSCPRCRS